MGRVKLTPEYRASRARRSELRKVEKEKVAKSRSRSAKLHSPHSDGSDPDKYLSDGDISEEENMRACEMLERVAENFQECEVLRSKTQAVRGDLPCPAARVSHIIRDLHAATQSLLKEERRVYMLFNSLQQTTRREAKEKLWRSEARRKRGE